MITCPVCGGQYEAKTTDGSQYYHVCPTEKIVTKAKNYSVKAGEKDLGEVITGLDAQQKPIIQKRVSVAFADRVNENIQFTESKEAYEMRVNRLLKEEKADKPIVRRSMIP